jgi:hypothetical protein
MGKTKTKKENFKEVLNWNLDPFFKRLEESLIKEIREDALENFFRTFANNLRRNEALAEEAKIFLIGIFVIGSVMWIGNRGIISTAHSEDNSEIVTNAWVKDILVPAKVREKPEIDNQRDSEMKMDVKVINDYKLKSSEEQCAEDKGQKKDSDLCGKDDEEEVKKIERQATAQRAARIAAFHPRVVTLSCRESNYGHPSRSDTKGKHMDEDCCPDPDEWPKPGCVYDAHGYSIMMSGSRLAHK